MLSFLYERNDVYIWYFISFNSWLISSAFLRYTKQFCSYMVVLSFYCWERKPKYITQCIRRDHRPSASNWTSFLTQSNWSMQDWNRHCLEVGDLLVWGCFPIHFATVAHIRNIFLWYTMLNKDISNYQTTFKCQLPCVCMWYTCLGLFWILRKLGWNIIIL
jgi:hypothetical protein